MKDAPRYKSGRKKPVSRSLAKPQEVNKKFRVTPDPTSDALQRDMSPRPVRLGWHGVVSLGPRETESAGAVELHADGQGPLHDSLHQHVVCCSQARTLATT